MSRKVTNVQNIDRRKIIRDMIVPSEEGEILIEGDLSQAEARIVAYKAEEPELIKLFESGAKVHEFVASMIFGRVITKKECPLEYHVGKTIAHASNYDTSPQKISQIVLNETGVPIPIPECRAKQNRYYQRFPRIRSVFQAEIRHELDTNLRMIHTPIGYGGWRRKFFGVKGNDMYRAAYAHYPQNLVGYVTYVALLRLTNEGWLSYLYTQTHDSILMSVPLEMTTRAAKALIAAMSYELEIKGKKFTIPVEIKIGKRLGSMEDYHV